MTYGLLDVAKDAIEGNLEYVTPQQQEARMNICRACIDHYKSLLKVCGHCGCYLPSKTKYKKTECPIGKWGQQS